MRPKALREASDWLRHADQDIETVRLTLQGPTFLPGIAAYHAQQAAEKALKGFPAAHDEPIPRTHDLARLTLLCDALDPRFVRHLPAARTLTPYAVAFRYPGAPIEPPLSEAQEAQRLAIEIVDAVRQALPRASSP